MQQQVRRALFIVANAAARRCLQNMGRGSLTTSILANCYFSAFYPSGSLCLQSLCSLSSTMPPLTSNVDPWTHISQQQTTRCKLLLQYIAKPSAKYWKLDLHTRDQALITQCTTWNSCCSPCPHKARKVTHFM